MLPKQSQQSTWLLTSFCLFPLLSLPLNLDPLKARTHLFRSIILLSLASGSSLLIILQGFCFSPASCVKPPPHSSTLDGNPTAMWPPGFTETTYLLVYLQWCAGKWLITGFLKKYSWLIVIADFHSINTPTVVDFKLPVWGHSMPTREEVAGCTASCRHSGCGESQEHR